MGRNNSIRTKSSSGISNYGTFNDYSSKQASRLLDNTNLKIISELLKNPNISSLTLANRLDIPLSTLQRRRVRIEKAILKKTYTLNYKAFGARVGDLIVNVDKGKSDQVAQNILKKHKNSVVYCHTRIDLVHSVLAHVIYKNTEDLYYLIEDIKAMQYVIGVSWSEIVNVIGDNNSEVMSAFFNN
jgi:DNA-binding Lrp family transcriptional regulator